jgi:hypothetical protein
MHGQMDIKHMDISTEKTLSMQYEIIEFLPVNELSTAGRKGVLQGTENVTSLVFFKAQDGQMDTLYLNPFFYAN